MGRRREKGEGKKKTDPKQTKTARKWNKKKRKSIRTILALKTKGRVRKSEGGHKDV